MMKKHLIQLVVIFVVLLSKGTPLLCEEGSGNTVAGNVGALVLGGGGTNAGTSSSVETDEFTGAATYTIPISVPPARGGVTPTIALNYNSYRKNSNSLVGYGWELELGSIVRTKPAIDNNSNGVIDYQNGREFEIRLGGQSERLILFQENIKGSDYGVDVGSGLTASVFLAQVESAFTYYILIRNNGANLDESWVAIDKSGTKYYFGTNEQSRVANGVNVSRWQLDRITDANGNEVLLFYDDNHWISLIHYQDQDIQIFFKKSDETENGESIPYYPLFNEGESKIFPLTKVLTKIDIRQDGSQLNLYQLHYQLSPLLRKRQLASIQQFGATNDESLPPITFKYRWEDNDKFSSLALASTSFPHDASKDGDYYDGLIGEKSAFADMNGDGLVDHVIAYENGPPGGAYKVLYNDGNNFAYKAGYSKWETTFDCWFSNDWDCRGKVNSFRKGHQWHYLMDMNGDGLPDRVVRVQPDKGNDNIADFHIAFNNGHGWGEIADWRDPYEGKWTGTADNVKGFADMNGDGLVDRVVGDSDGAGGKGFNVYFNTGAGFKKSAVFWLDPLYLLDPNNTNSVGKITATEDQGAGHQSFYALIRDFNGDGLPDRITRVEIKKKDGQSLGFGFAIFLNKDGKQWALNTKPNGIDTLSMVDPVINQGFAGYVERTHDWIDVNGDGFLDRVEGDPDNSYIRVFFYRGMTWQEQTSALSPMLELSDPINNTGTVNDQTGYFTNDSGNKATVFFQDFNGDGLPDRLAYDWDNGNYQYYSMRHSAMPFSDTPDWWDDKFVSQPLGALHSVDDGRGHQTAIEYQPSTWRLTESFVPNHRFLPFNLNVVHKLYTHDPTFRSDLFDSDKIPEAKRNSGMRWVTYAYRGGNFFVKHAVKFNPNDINDDQITTTHASKFNGFQKVEKTPAKAPDETWETYSTTTLYHQSEGDVDPTGGNAKYWFNTDGYKNHALSGRPFLIKVVEWGNKEIVREESGWQLTEYATVANPNTKYWWPHLSSQKKIVKDGTGQARTTSINYTYDNTANVLSEKVMDGDGNEILTKETEYFSAGDLGSSPQIRDRPKLQKKSKNGMVARQKGFLYDTKGNPTTETLETGSQALKITRAFDSQGKMTSMTDVDGVVKNISYENNLFPVKETMVGAGKSLIVNRQFERRTGETKDEEGPQKVGKRIEYDSFGRPVLEYLREANGNEQLVKKYQYEYLFQLPPSIPTEGPPPSITTLKTSVWKVSPEDSNTESGHEAEISYADPSGRVLQQCVRSERGDLRVIHKRYLNAGREEITTEPTFATDCNYLFYLDDKVPKHRVKKDLQGRVTLIDPPDGDSSSPVGDTTFTYKHLSGGQLEKTTTNANSQVYVEVFDINDRLVRVTDPDKGVIEYEYNAVGDLRKVISSGKVLTEMKYDQLGRKTSMTDINMGTWTYVYDDKGHLSFQTDANGNKILFAYDDLSRVTKKEFFQDNVMEKYESYEYDSGGNGFEVKPGELYKVTEYDGKGKEVRSTSFSYDSKYRRTEKIVRTIVTTAGETTFEQILKYDFLGKVITNIFPNNYSLSYQYMLNGNLKQVTGGEETYYQLDPNSAYSVFGNLLEEKYGNGVKATYEYYPLSHRLKEKKITGPDAAVLVQKQYEHDTLANLTKVNDPSGTTEGFFASIQNVKYDSLNRLTAFDQAGESLSMAYDGLGNIKTNSKSFGKGEYQYDPLKVHQVSKIVGMDENNKPQTLRQFSYDNNGNITSDGDRVMTYNTQNQLAQVQMKNGRVVGYDYDYTGARVRKDVTATNPLKITTTTSTHFLGDAMELKGTQLVLNIFAGQRKVATRVLTDNFKLAANAGGSNLVYSGIETRWDLPQVTPYFFVLLALFLLGSLRPVPAPSPFGEMSGRQPWWADTSFDRLRTSWVCPYINKIHSLYHAWYRYRASLQESLACFHERSWAKAFVLFLITLSVIQPPTLAFAGEPTEAPAYANDATYFYYIHDDHLGSSMLLTEGKDTSKHAGITYKKGQILQRFEYSPFGGEIYALNPNLKFDPSYTGQRYDIETGLYYYQSRYYDPVLGRFIQPDTVIPDAKDLQSYNRYSYVRNNPLKYVDPSGHSFGSWFKKLFGAFIGALLAVVSGFTLAPLVGAYWAGVIAGTVGGLISGAITGGLKGALLGGLFGALSGAVFGGLNIGLEKLGIADQWARAGILAGVGAGLSAATGGWQGLVIFGAGLAGAAAGYGIGKPIGAKVGAWKARQDMQLQGPRSKFRFEYSNQGGEQGSPTLAGVGEGGNDLLQIPEGQTTDAQFGAGQGNQSGIANGHPGQSIESALKIDVAANMYVRALTGIAGVEMMQIGAEVMAVGGGMIIGGGPAGAVAGAFLIVKGGSLFYFGVRLTSWSAGFTDRIVPSWE